DRHMDAIGGHPEGEIHRALRPAGINAYKIGLSELHRRRPKPAHRASADIRVDRSGDRGHELLDLAEHEDPVVDREQTQTVRIGDKQCIGREGKAADAPEIGARSTWVLRGKCRLANDYACPLPGYKITGKAHSGTQ